MLKFTSPIFRRSLWILLALLIASVGFFVAFSSAANIDKSIRLSLAKRAETVAAALDGDMITHLSGSEIDLTNDYYISLKSHLSDIRTINPDIRFIYIFGLRDDNVFFYVDSEASDSQSYSPPGQIYHEASPQLFQAFKNGNSFVEGPVQDRWGSWLSALAPINDLKENNTKVVVGIVGMDVSNSDRQKQIFGVVSRVAGITFLAELLLLFLFLYLRHKRIIKAVEEEKKMQARQYEFVSMISHQLRTPISSARMIVEALKDEKGLEALGDAYDKINHLNSIVNTLLFFIENKEIFSHKKMVMEKKSDLVSVVSNQLGFLKKNIADKKITVKVKLPKELALPVDEVLLSRIIYTILENAITYNKEFGTINVSFKEDSGHPILIIADSGVGIPAKEQKNVFTPFFRATNASLGSNEGSGLSLYITKEIVRLLGGQITFTSIEGKGSSFYLHF
jgi:signal transduction histidine kinase